MRLYVYLVALTVVVSSCGSSPERSAPVPRTPPSVTDNAKAGVKEITDFYGGRCNLTTGVSDKNRRFARVEISNSAALDSSANITELNVGNIALVYYKDLQGDVTNYDDITAAILFGNGQTVDKTYPVSELAMVLDKTQIVGDVVNALQRRDYKSLDTLLNSGGDIHQYNKDGLIEQIKKSDESLGKIKTFVPYGFMMIKSSNGKQVLHFSGVLIRDKKNSELSIDVDPSSRRNVAIFINYKL